MNKPVYDLEERTFQFAKQIRIFVRQLPKTEANLEDCKQVIRSSGPVGTNYIEANEALSKKDFLMRIKYVEKKPKRVLILSVSLRRRMLFALRKVHQNYIMK